MFATFLSGGGVQYNRLLSSFLFLALFFVFSCKNQTNRPNIPPDVPPKQNEIVITVSGDSNVKIAQSPSFNVLKNSTWADVKVKANQKVSFSDGFILKSWRLANKYGKLLLDTEVFTENTTVFAVSQTDIPPKQNEIVITVSGDSNVKIAQSPSFNVLKNSAWADVKVKANQKVSFSDGFVLKSWHLTNKDGKLLVDTEVFTENTTVFAVSQKENIPEESEKPVKDEDGNEIKEEIIGEEGKDKEVKATIEVVEVKEEGKEKPTTKLKVSGNILSDETKRIADILRSKVYEYKNKKDELKTIQFDALSNNSTLNIQFKDESKKINVEDLKILVAKIPNQVKIDNEDCITLDKSANITSIKGTVSLKNIVKGANSNSELTKWEFISDKINTAETSVNSTALNITSTEKDSFTKANLETVARKLTETNITNTTVNGTQKISINKDGSIKTISGEVSLKDVLEAKDEATTGLTNYALHSLKENKDPTFASQNLKINTFYKTLKPGHTGSSISLLNIDDVNYTLTPITLSFLKDMEQTALNKTSFNYKDGNKTIGVSFGENNSYDITEFAKEIKTNNKLKELLELPTDVIQKTKFLLTGERTLIKPDGGDDETPYPRVTELLSIIETPALKGKVKVGKTKLRGNMKNLLPHLVKENNIIEEKYGNITIPGFLETDCSGDLWTGYNGYISKEKTQSILKAEEFWELHTRTNEGQSYIRNAIIQNFKTKENLNAHSSCWSNVTFEDCDLGSMSIDNLMTGGTSLTFINTILPYTITDSSIGSLVLNNTTLPAQKMVDQIKLILPETGLGAEIIIGLFPGLNKLEIYGYLKNDLPKLLTPEQLKRIKDGYKNEEMPSTYKGPEDIYEKLKKYIYKGESTKKEFGNFTSSLNKKPQSPVLLALLQGKTDHTRG